MSSSSKSSPSLPPLLTDYGTSVGPPVRVVRHDVPLQISNPLRSDLHGHSSYPPTFPAVPHSRPQRSPSLHTHCPSYRRLDFQIYNQTQYFCISCPENDSIVGVLPPMPLLTDESSGSKTRREWRRTQVTHRNDYVDGGDLELRN